MLAAETAQEREERLRQLSHNLQCRMEEAIYNSCVAPARNNAEHLSSYSPNYGGGISYVLLNAHARSLRGEFKGQSRQESRTREIVALLNRLNIGRCVQCDEELRIEHGTL